jgi:diguanylate cyclase (GGDEF)-like protein
MATFDRTPTVLADALTGLPARRAWDAELPRELARARRRAYVVSVALVDLDRFALVAADGAQAADRLLTAAAAAWKAELRAGDVIARYGGDEFAVLLPACGPEHALVVLERLRGATPWAQTCSVGTTWWDGLEGLDPLVARADRALRLAKALGRDRVVQIGPPAILASAA